MPDLTTGEWIGLASASAGTIGVLIALFAWIRGSIDRGIDAKMGSVLSPILELSMRASELVDSARDAEQKTREQLRVAGEAMEQTGNRIRNLGELAEKQQSEHLASLERREQAIRSLLQEAQGILEEIRQLRSSAESDASEISEIRGEAQLATEVERILRRLGAFSHMSTIPLPQGQFEADIFGYFGDVGATVVVETKVVGRGSDADSRSVSTGVRRASELASELAATGLDDLVVLVLSDNAEIPAEVQSQADAQDVKIVPLQSFRGLVEPWLNERRERTGNPDS